MSGLIDILAGAGVQTALKRDNIGLLPQCTARGISEPVLNKMELVNWNGTQLLVTYIANSNFGDQIELGASAKVLSVFLQFCCFISRIITMDVSCSV